MQKNDSRISRLEKIRWIDSLKGFACILVMITHIIASDPHISMYANGCGKIGVWLFMLISGMLYAKSSFHQNGVSFRRLLDFYRKKIIRIYPSYYFALLVLLFIGFLDISGVKDNLLFQSAWGHLWYIPVILKFYLIAPFFTLMKQATERLAQHGIHCFIFLLIVIGVLVAIIFPYQNYPENSIQLCWYLPVYIAGIALGTYKWENNRQTIWADIGAFIGCFIILALTPLGRELLFGEPLSRYLQNKYLLIGGCWVLIIVGIRYGKQTGKAVERIPGVVFISKYSFELYLIHYIILSWINVKCPMETWLRGLFTIVISFIIAIPLKNGFDWIGARIGRKNQLGSIVLTYTTIILMAFIVK